MISKKTLIQPWLSLGNSAKAQVFYKQAFGAIETYRMETPDGGLVLKLAVDGSEFWVSGQAGDSLSEQIHDFQRDVIKLVLIVENPDALFEQAINAGAKEVFAVGEDFGWRLGRLTDPFGIDWEIGKPLN